MPFCKCGNFYVNREKEICGICELQEQIAALKRERDELQNAYDIQLAANITLVEQVRDYRNKFNFETEQNAVLEQKVKGLEKRLEPISAMAVRYA